MLLGDGWTMNRVFSPLRCLALSLFLSSGLGEITTEVKGELLPRQSGNQSVIPAPVVVAASQDWDGDDGPWSSFAIQVGNPAQIVKIFPSTSGYQTIVVLKQGCTTSDPTNCADLRGRIFHPTVSTSWVNNTANLTTQIYPNNIGKAVGYVSKGVFGFDDVTLDWPGSGGPTLKNQTVGGIASKDSFLGQFGLAPRASNFTSFSDPIPSYMENLKSQKKIPSISWAYTAGNQYRLGGTLGSLVLGGFDRSKLIAHNVTWTMNSRDIRDLTVQIEDITTSISSGGRRLLEEPVPAFLDSSVSYMWLPESSCKLFEQAFNLRWNSTTNLYLLNDAEHETLLALNPSITFRIGNLTDGADVNITLPYGAFDLDMSAPLVPEKTFYFPLKRALNSTQVTLGRVFFQEAYVIADYERGNFSVSQVNWTANAKEDIVAILPPSSQPTPSDAPEGNSKPPVGAIVGGVVGGAVLLFAFGLAIYYFRIKKRKLEEATKATGSNTPSGGEPSAFDASRVEYKHELQAEDPFTSDSPDKAEMDAEGVQRAELQDGADGSIPKRGENAVMHEMDGGGNRWTVVEADGREVEIHEMPAAEVAVEMQSDERHVQEPNAGGMLDYTRDGHRSQ